VQNRKSTHTVQSRSRLTIEKLRTKILNTSLTNYTKKKGLTLTNNFIPLEPWNPKKIQNFNTINLT